MSQLETEQYLVVGGSHGIGAGVVHRLLSAGAAVVNVSRTPPTVDASDQLTHLSLDLTSGKLEKDHLPERLNGLIYCPGSINLGPLRQLGRQSMLEDYQLNVVSAVECRQAAVPALRATGAASAVFAQQAASINDESQDQSSTPIAESTATVQSQAACNIAQNVIAASNDIGNDMPSYLTSSNVMNPELSRSYK